MLEDRGDTRYGASSSMANQFAAACVSVSVCAAGKEKKLISTGRNVFTSKRLGGGYERERWRGREKERGLSLQTLAAVSHFGQAAADRE